MSQLIKIHEAYKIAKDNGYKEKQPLSYMMIVAIVSEAYKQGYKQAEAERKPHS